MHWIVIASSTRARVLERAPDGVLSVLHALAREASRSRSAELDNDRAGWRLGRAHAGGAAMLPRLDSHRAERLRFAAELGAELETGARAGAFDALTIVAAEPFVGDLRKELGASSRRRLQGVVGLDLCHVGWAELRSRVDDALERV